jgi:hypothetical protein
MKGGGNGRSLDGSQSGRGAQFNVYMNYGLTRSRLGHSLLKLIDGIQKLVVRFLCVECGCHSCEDCTGHVVCSLEWRWHFYGWLHRPPSLMRSIGNLVVCLWV